MEQLPGLTQEEAQTKLAEYGFNEVRDKNKVTPLQILLRQVQKNLVIYLLTITALVSLFLGKQETSIVIFAVITVVVLTGFLQEYKAENAIQALKQMIMPVTRVIRNGREQEVPSRELVPGDIVILRSGEKVPADCIIIEESNLELNESVLTGESEEVKKTAPQETSSYADENLVFMGSFVVSGRCSAKIVHTGMNTKFGKIAGMISDVEKKYPLQDKVNNITKYMVIVGLVASLTTGIILFSRAEVLTTQIFVEILVIVIALSVSSFPESFPVVLTITLAAGVHRMAKQNAIVNRMSVIETLGETTVICSDKTGTLTRGEMTIRSIWTDEKLLSVSGVGYEAKGEITDNIQGATQDNKILTLLLKTAVLCNDASIERTGEDEEYHVLGTPTEGSFLILAAKTGVFKENFPLKRVEEIPFDSERKMMSAAYLEDNKLSVYAKGGTEVLLQKCTHIQKGDKISELMESDKETILKINQAMASKALRTMGLGYKIADGDKSYSEDKFIFLGIVGMEDPPREEAAEAIETCNRAGIIVKMVTGDNKTTALAIAQQIGLSGDVLEGDQLDTLTDDKLRRLVTNTSIFARVKPEHKLRIVNALKANGEIVAMTGDGVNDAPALKEAHIGIAMGKNGTDVSRSVADITLKDDNFSTIVASIKEGRTIFNNIRKFVTYQLSCNLAEIFIIFSGVLLAPYLGWYVPIISALQILFMNLVTDNLPAITLGFNPTSKDIMKERPRRKTEILTHEFLRVVIFNGIFMGLVTAITLFLVFNILRFESEVARTTTLVTMIVLDIVSAYNFRSFRYGVLSRNLFVNKYLVLASVVSLLATVVVVYSPLQKMFETTPLGIESWLIAGVAGFSMVVVFDILKIINNKTHKLLPHTT